MMDEGRYRQLADETISAIETMFEDVDPSVVDCERSGDVLTLTFASGQRAVINTQRPTRQIWVAAHARAWHFAFDAPSSCWLDEKGTGTELFTNIAEIVKTLAGVDLTVPALRFA